MKILFAVSFVLILFNINAQNLVPNSSFEIQVDSACLDCKDKDYLKYYLKNWESSTPDSHPRIYSQENNDWKGIYAFPDSIQAHSGKTSLLLCEGDFIHVELSKYISTSSYFVEFWYLPLVKEPKNPLGLFFSSSAINHPINMVENHINYFQKPNIIVPQNQNFESNKWQKVEMFFDYGKHSSHTLTIGQFPQDIKDWENIKNVMKKSIPYYFIDDLNIREATNDEINKYNLQGSMCVLPMMEDGKIYFDSTEYKLNEKMKYKLCLYKDFYNELIYYPCNFIIEGHSEATGNEKFEEKISIKRANRVKKYLEKIGFNPKYLKVETYGSSRPIASNNSIEGRKKNRRVEVWVNCDE